MVLFHNIISITIWDLADRTLQYLYRSETWLHIKLYLNHSDNDMVGICVSGSFIKMAQFLGENWAHYRVTLVCYWTARKSINVYTYNHKTSPGFCAELRLTQAINTYHGDGGFAGQIILFTTNDLHSPLFLILHMPAIAWIKKIFLWERGGGGGSVRLCSKG